MKLNEQQFDEAIQYLEESWLESLISRPKEFFKKVKLYRVSLFKEDLVGQHCFNPGTRLSKPRMSSFWIAGEKQWTYIYGFRVAINDLFDKVSGYNYFGNSKEEKEKYFAKMKDECRFDLISEDGFCINATNYPEEFVRKNLKPVYLYELEIKGKDTGIGWHNKSEYTIDKDVKPDSVTVLDYDFFKKVLKLEYVKEPQYKIRREEKRLHNQNKKKQPGYKKWDEKLGFPYADDPRTFMNQRCESFFNDAIKSAMREKNEEKRISLLKDIGEKYKLVFGYRLGFFTGNIEIPKEYEYLFKEDLKETIEYLEESFFSEENIELNLDKWNEKNNKILFITGLSGGGKSTLSRKMSEEHNAPICELDLFYLTRNPEDIFLKKIEKDKREHPSHTEILNYFVEFVYKEKVEFNWGERCNFYKNKEEFYKKTEELNNLSFKFTKWVEPKLKSKYIVEGVHIYQTFDVDYLENKPIIIIGTGRFKSTVQNIKRTVKKQKTNREKIEKIFSFFKLLHWNKNEDKKLTAFKNSFKE